MRSSKIILLAVVAFALVFGGCKHPKTGNLTVQFKTRFNGQNVTLDTTTFTSNGKLYQFLFLKFYLSHINLVGNDGSLTEVSPVQLIDFSNPNSLVLNFKNLKGDYKAIQFGSGLDSAQNYSNPTNLDTTNSGSPLAAANCGDMYWEMQKYRFQSFDGKWDYTTNTYNFLTRSFSYHVGATNLYKTPVIVSKNFSVGSGNTTNLVLYLDIEKIFNGATETIDIASEGQTQTLGT
ncbi:MAG: hypothetical protein JWO06_1598, partial [Bacteroidota bacterium]|nr:hypothetical protein [Bacteroidota bacterium]